MNEDRMTFGRHKGMAVAHLPVDYLGWVAERMPHPPAYLLAELRRRAAMKDTRDALERHRMARAKLRRDGWHGWLAEQKAAGRQPPHLCLAQAR